MNPHPISNAHLPTSHGDFRCLVFQEERNGTIFDHVALVMGDPEDGTLVRIHSECMTGEIFGSLRCDCGEQLHSALKKIASEKKGVLIYLRQEGRGIGLAHKIKAYEKQDEEGLDTVDANLALDLPEDARTYEMAKKMLEHLQLKHIRLLTNNPAKVVALEKLGFEVSREEHEVTASENSHAYLKTKRERMGHILNKL